MLGPHFCARAFSSCGKRGPLFIAARGPLTITASLVAEHRLQMRRLNNCGSRAQPLRGTWDPPRPGLEPVSPALAGGLSTTAPPGKPETKSFYSQSCTQFIRVSIHFVFVSLDPRPAYKAGSVWAPFTEVFTLPQRGSDWAAVPWARVQTQGYL